MWPWRAVIAGRPEQRVGSEGVEVATWAIRAPAALPCRTVHIVPVSITGGASVAVDVLSAWQAQAAGLYSL